jgi:gliding motility-associated-like protein
VNDSVSVSFAWDPSTGLNDPTALRPVLVALRDETYTLTATGEGNCTAKDQITVKILKPVKIPNAFSPNGDGINDRWDITNLSDYPGATVEVFNRFGQPVFFSKGYNDPWDGKNKGNALPVATYYYVITLKNGFQPITGSLTIVR